MSGKAAYEAAKMIRTAIVLIEAATSSSDDNSSSSSSETTEPSEDRNNYDRYDAEKDNPDKRC